MEQEDACHGILACIIQGNSLAIRNKEIDPAPSLQMTSCLCDISLGHVDAEGREPRPSLFEKVEGTSKRATRRAALYLLVSTDRQTIENQEIQLRQVAERRGWEVVEIYPDAGISGSKSRADRAGLDRMLNDGSHRHFDVVLCLAIDRLGRSLIDLLGTIQHLEAVGVDLYIDQQSIDTTTPMGS